MGQSECYNTGHDTIGFANVNHCYFSPYQTIVSYNKPHRWTIVAVISHKKKSGFRLKSQNNGKSPVSNKLITYIFNTHHNFKNLK